MMESSDLVNKAGFVGELLENISPSRTVNRTAGANDLFIKRPII